MTINTHLSKAVVAALALAWPEVSHHSDISWLFLPGHFHNECDKLLVTNYNGMGYYESQIDYLPKVNKDSNK